MLTTRNSAKAVLFDLDGTLIDTVALILASMRYATESVLGRVLSDDTLMRNVGVPLATQMSEFSSADVEELVRVYRVHNAQVHDDLIGEYPGTEAVLVELTERGVPLGVVTSKGRVGALRGLERFGLERFFEVVISADDVEIHKPDPFPLVRAAELMGYELHECIYVGDSPHDMTAAICGGATSVAALWGAFPAEQVLAPGPDYAIASIHELLALLDGGAEQ